jgi:hypothetical protein
MNNTSETQTSTLHLLALERAALDRWGNGDPSELYATDITYFDPLTARHIVRWQEGGE